MENENTLRLNLRILMWHLQITPDWKFSWTYNDYHKYLSHGWFKLYTWKLFASKENFDFSKAGKQNNSTNPIELGSHFYFRKKSLYLI
jgi:hypothetical protein